jgi:hypothetical protein
MSFRSHGEAGRHPLKHGRYIWVFPSVSPCKSYHRERHRPIMLAVLYWGEAGFAPCMHCIQNDILKEYVAKAFSPTPFKFVLMP